MNQIEHVVDSAPSIGDLAYNEDGALGVIISTSTETIESTGFIKSKVARTVYVGVHVSSDHAPKGSPWKSVKPSVIGCVGNAQAFAESLKE
jgi:hypothetical protein